METINFYRDKIGKAVTKVDFGSFWFCLWAGAKISIHVVDPHICIEQINTHGTSFDCKLTRETYKETVIRVATEFDAFDPEMLLPFARDEKVPQTQIKTWMLKKKHGDDSNMPLRSHFMNSVISGFGK